MRRIGIHTSSGGSLLKAATKAAALGANCFQIFSSSPRMWRSKLPEKADCHELAKLRDKHDLFPLVIHDSYLINLAAFDEVIRGKSIQAFRDELEIAFQIGAEYLVMHPGSARNYATREDAILQIADSLERAAEGLRPSKGFRLLLEITAGSGSNLGNTFGELKAIRDVVQQRVDFPVGYCLDTCHLLVAGYDVVSEAGLKKVVSEADRILDLDLVPVVHTNDSKGKLGSKLDRHANIGEGEIGLEAFARILNHQKLKSKAFILETPVDEEGDDQRNVDALKGLVRR